MGKTKTKERPERNLSIAQAECLDSSSAWAWANDPTPKRPQAVACRQVACRQYRLADPPAVTVPRGAKWLDITSPPWFRRVPFDRVDIQSIAGCPLSNAFLDDFGRPSFDLGVRRLCRPKQVLQVESSLSPGQRPSLPRYKGADTDRLAYYGFLPYRDDLYHDPYTILNDLWRAEILKRLERTLSQ